MVGDELMGLFEVPVDLLELQVRNTEFDISSIQREIKNQLMRNRGNRSSANAYVILNKKQQPVRDMVDTRGMPLFI